MPRLAVTSPVDPLLFDLADRPTPSLQGFDPVRRANLSVCQVIDDIAHILGPDSNRVHALRVDMVIYHRDKVLDQRIGNQGCIVYWRPGRQGIATAEDIANNTLRHPDDCLVSLLLRCADTEC